MTGTTSRLLTPLLLCLIGGTLVRWWLRGELVNYLHPKTIWVTGAGGAVLMALALKAVVDRRSPRPSAVQLAVLLFVVGTMGITRPAPLSFALVRQRQAGAAVPVASRNTIDLGRLSEGFTILDWQYAWESDPTHQRYRGARVHVTGFVAAQGDRPAVARLVITCCAIDARPVWLGLDTPDPLPAAGTWITVDGEMAIAGSDPLIRVERLTVVEPPANPYLH